MIIYRFISIRICPDWNVKGFDVYDFVTFEVIRICPDWNVKDVSFIEGINLDELEYVQIGM